jgi:uncharacterized protein
MKPAWLSRRTVIAISAGLVASVAAGPRLARAKTRITIVTGGTGGVFYPYGGGIAKILSEKVPDMQATAQVTGGSVDNVKLLAAGEAELGFATLDSAWEGLNGLGAYAKDGKQDIRTVALLYDSFFHVCAAADAQIGKVADFKGRRVSVGSAGSSTESIADRVLKAAGLDPQADVGRDNLGVSESTGALKDGKIVGFFWIGGVPTAAVKDLAASGQPKITFIPTHAELQVIDKEFPGLYRPFTLKPNSYAGQDQEVAGLGVANLLLVAANAPDDLVKNILEGIFANLEDVKAIHPEARKLSLAGAAAKTAVPLHPAAAAFYQSKGVQL